MECAKASPTSLAGLQSAGVQESLPNKKEEKVRETWRDQKQEENHKTRREGGEKETRIDGALLQYFLSGQRKEEAWLIESQIVPK